jgi:hypothetical protein
MSRFLNPRNRTSRARCSVGIFRAQSADAFPLWKDTLLNTNREAYRQHRDPRQIPGGINLDQHHLNEQRKPANEHANIVQQLEHDIC